MLQNLMIRPFQEDDFGAVVALWQLVFPDAPAHNPPDLDIRRKLSVQRELFLVGLLDHEVVGTAMAGYDGHRGWVYYVAVTPQCRRQGIGSALMRRVEAELAQVGCPKINLQVRASNQAVVAFYQHLGYLIEERVSMGKRLSDQYKEKEDLMEEEITKTELLELIQEEWKLLEDVLKGIDHADMLAAVLPGGWSIKDVLAHITTWEENMISWLGIALQGKEPQMVPPGYSSWDEIDAINKSYYERNKKKSLDQILRDFPEVYKRALKITQDAPEDDLFDADRFPWRKGDPIWHMVAENTCWHYKEHRIDIETWIASE